MTLNKKQLMPVDVEAFERELTDKEAITNVREVVRGEHPEDGDTVLVKKLDGSGLALADSIRFIDRG